MNDTFISDQAHAADLAKVRRILPVLLAILAFISMACKKETSYLAPEINALPEEKDTKIKGSREFTEIYDMI